MMVGKLRKITLISVLFAIALVFGLALVNVEEARADWYFSRVSIKKCNLRLEAESFNWTGNEIRPYVTVTYEGKRLVLNKDYELSYDNNVDAGLDTAEVKVKGIGDYRSSMTLSFDILGIDIAKECTFQYKNNKVIVFYRGKEIGSRNYKTYKGDKERRLINVTPGNNPREQYCTYELYQDITVVGKGQYYGEYVYRTVEVETVLEEKADDKPDGPGHGGGHGPGPGPNPGHGGGNNPGPGPNPGHGGGNNPGPGPNPGHGPR